MLLRGGFDVHTEGTLRAGRALFRLWEFKTTATYFLNFF